MGKTEELEAKILKIAELIASLRKENQKLRQESDALKSHLSLLNNENSRAQHILADFEQMKRKQDVATQKVERALQTLNALRGA